MPSTAASASSAWFPEASLDVEQESSLGRIGPYQILKRIGVGGMGEVFLAYDSRLDRRVAIKRIRPGPEVTPVSRERFRREARLAARLSHSAIVQVYDILEEEGSEYIVMEYVEGATLRDQVRRGPMDVRAALELARELAAGLDTAHRQGILHRDLKTENVLIPTSGGAKILDFGIAKRLLDSEEEGSLTAESSILGTCRAMSPEQARGEPLDSSTDLFSLGVLLYETLTGTSPFEAESQVEHPEPRDPAPADAGAQAQSGDPLAALATDRPASGEDRGDAPRLGRRGAAGAGGDRRAPRHREPLRSTRPEAPRRPRSSSPPWSTSRSLRGRARPPRAAFLSSFLSFLESRSCFWWLSLSRRCSCGAEPAISPPSRSRSTVCRRPARARRSPSSGSRISRRRGRAPGWARPSPK